MAEYCDDCEESNANLTIGVTIAVVLSATASWVAAILLYT